MQEADPIVGIRIALNPIVRRPDGKEELLGEIAAEVLDIPGDLTYIQNITTRIAGLWHSGEVVTWAGPSFDMIPKRA